MRKILEKTISSFGVQVRNGLSNVFSEDRYDSIINNFVCYLLLFYKTLYHRRVRDTNCVIGDKPKAADKVVRNCWLWMVRLFTNCIVFHVVYSSMPNEFNWVTSRTQTMNLCLSLVYLPTSRRRDLKGWSRFLVWTDTVPTNPILAELWGVPRKCSTTGRSSTSFPTNSAWTRLEKKCVCCPAAASN